MSVRVDLNGLFAGTGAGVGAALLSPEHLEALDRHGPCPIHRYSFSPVAVQELPLEL